MEVNQQYNTSLRVLKNDMSWDKYNATDSGVGVVKRERTGGGFQNNKKGLVAVGGSD